MFLLGKKSGICIFYFTPPTHGAEGGVVWLKGKEIREKKGEKINKGKRITKKSYTYSRKIQKDFAPVCNLPTWHFGGEGVGGGEFDIFKKYIPLLKVPDALGREACLSVKNFKPCNLLWLIWEISLDVLIITIIHIFKNLSYLPVICFCPVVYSSTRITQNNLQRR